MLLSDVYGHVNRFIVCRAKGFVECALRGKSASQVKRKPCFSSKWSSILILLQLLCLLLFKVKEVYLPSLYRPISLQLMKTYSLLSEGIRVTIISGDLHFNFTYTRVLLRFIPAAIAAPPDHFHWTAALLSCMRWLLIVLIFLWLTWCFTPRCWCLLDLHRGLFGHSCSV